MKWLSVAALLLLLGLAPGGGLQAQPAAQAARPALAILPLKEEGHRDLGDVSDSMNLVVANAFADSGFRLLDRRPTAAPDPVPSGPALADLGRSLGARYLLVGSFLPEYNLARGTVTVTLSLRVVDSANGTTFRGFQEVASGASLGSVMAALTHQLADKTAGSGAAAVPVAVSAPAVAAVAASVASPAPMAAAVAASVATPASTPAAVAAPVPTPAPAPAAVTAPGSVFAAGPQGRVLLVLREGMINDIYYRNGGLGRFGAKLEDFRFLLDATARLFPSGTSVVYDLGGRGAADDLALNRELVQKYHPDHLVVLALGCRTRDEKRLLLLEKHLVQTELQVDVLDPESLAVLATRKVLSGYLEAKGLRETLPASMKDQLARQFAAALPALP